MMISLRIFSDCTTYYLLYILFLFMLVSVDLCGKSILLINGALNFSFNLNDRLTYIYFQLKL